MITTRSVVNFPLTTSTTIMLLGAATNISMVVAALAVKHFVLMSASIISASLFLLGAYYSRKYIVVQINVTPVHTYGPINSITVDGYTVTNERSPTPIPLNASVINPSLQHYPQTTVSSNSGTQALNLAP